MKNELVRGVVALFLCAAALCPATARAGNGDQARVDLREQMTHLIGAGRFAEIVARAEADLGEGTRLPDGVWRGYETYMAFEESLNTRQADDPGWEPLLNTLRDRAQARPGDVFLYVQALHARAWKVRGGGVIGTVAHEKRQSFRGFMELARDALDRNRRSLATSPMWWAQRTTVANELGEGPERLQTIFQEGLRRFPHFHPLYWTRVRSLTPKWGGSEDALMDLLDAVAAMPEPAVKEGLYARVVWAAEDEDQLLFLDPRFKKELWRASFDSLVREWPDARNRQRYFFNACEMSDKPLAATQIAALDEPVREKRLMRNQPLMDRCRDWALNDADFVMGLRYRGEKRQVFVH